MKDFLLSSCSMVSGKSNIILTGMAGSGKSSVGKMLARMLELTFIDTDDLIVQAQGLPLQEIIETEGPIGFRRIEEEILLSINVCNHIIATGGSSIYSEPGMVHLKSNGLVVLLQANMEVLEKRVGDTSKRGLVKHPGQSFEDLYVERRPLYEHYADMTVECSGLDVEDVCMAITSQLKF